MTVERIILRREVRQAELRRHWISAGSGRYSPMQAIPLRSRITS